MLRFVHAADLHLDSPFQGWTQRDGALAEKLRSATFRAFDRLVGLCLAEEVDFLLVAGDVYDGADRSLRAQLAFRDGLARLADAGISSFVVHGNHDPLDGWTSSIRWPEGVTLFPADEPLRVPVEKDGRVVAEIAGISYAKRSESRPLQMLLEPGSTGAYQIALLHAHCGGSRDHEVYVPCSPEELKGRGFDYWALGHVHERTDWHDGPRIVYPGNLQGRSIRERGPRGAYLVTVEPGGASRLEFRELGVLRWQIAALDIADIETVDELTAALEETALDAAREASPHDVLLRMRLEGAGSLTRELERMGALEDLLERLRLQLEAAASGVFVESLRDDTRSPVDLKRRRSEGDFLAHVLGVAEELRSEEALPEEIRELLKGVFAHHAAKGILRSLDDIPFDDWLERAERLCCELLDERE